jgi:hypothetical protein
MVSVLSLVASGCAAAPVTSTVKSGPERLSVSAVLVVRPAIRFQRVEDDVEVTMPEEGRRAYEAKLLVAAGVAVERSGLALASLSGDPDTDSALSVLHASELRLARGLTNDATLAAMRRLAGRNPDVAVLVHAFEATVGPGGTWNAWSGAITSSMSRSAFRAALVMCSSGEVLWAQQVQLRDLPAVDASPFQDALTALYASFPRKVVSRP